jgi:hypothetical protein
VGFGVQSIACAVHARWAGAAARQLDTVTPHADLGRRFTFDCFGGAGAPDVIIWKALQACPSERGVRRDIPDALCILLLAAFAGWGVSCDDQPLCSSTPFFTPLGNAYFSLIACLWVTYVQTKPAHKHQLYTHGTCTCPHSGPQPQPLSTFHAAPLLFRLQSRTHCAYKTPTQKSRQLCVVPTNCRLPHSRARHPHAHPPSPDGNLCVPPSTRAHMHDHTASRPYPHLIHTHVSIATTQPRHPISVVLMDTGCHVWWWSTRTYRWL